MSIFLFFVSIIMMVVNGTDYQFVEKSIFNYWAMVLLSSIILMILSIVLGRKNKWNVMYMNVVIPCFFAIITGISFFSNNKYLEYFTDSMNLVGLAFLISLFQIGIVLFQSNNMKNMTIFSVASLEIQFFGAMLFVLFEDSPLGSTIGAVIIFIFPLVIVPIISMFNVRMKSVGIIGGITVLLIIAIAFYRSNEYYFAYKNGANVSQLEKHFNNINADDLYKVGIDEVGYEERSIIITWFSYNDGKYTYDFLDDQEVVVKNTKTRRQVKLVKLDKSGDNRFEKKAHEIYAMILKKLGANWKMKFY